MNLKCSFRIIGLSEHQLNDLIQRHLQNVKFRTGCDHRDKSKKILRLPIEETTCVGLLKVLLEESPDGVYHDFFISVILDQQTAVIEIPEFALGFHAVIGGSMCFSYSCIIHDE